MVHWTASDWALIMGAVGAVVTALTAALVSMIGAVRGVANKVDMLEVKVDGRLTQLLAQTAAASNAAGRELGRGETIVTSAPPVGAGAALGTGLVPSEVPFDASASKLVIGIPEPVPTVVLVPMPEKKDEPGNKEEPAAAKVADDFSLPPVELKK